MPDRALLLDVHVPADAGLGVEQRLEDAVVRAMARADDLDGERDVGGVVDRGGHVGAGDDRDVRDEDPTWSEPDVRFTEDVPSVRGSGVQRTPDAVGETLVGVRRPRTHHEGSVDEFDVSLRREIEPVLLGPGAGVGERIGHLLLGCGHDAPPPGEMSSVTVMVAP